MLRVNNVSKYFSESKALDNVTLNVKKGEILAVMGPSGSGKTTLLRLVDLLDYPSSGKIIFDGIDTDGSYAHRLAIRRRIGMVAQQPTLFDRSVHDNVAYGLRVRGVNKDEIADRVRKALEVVGLSEFEKRNALTLSGGEAQRVAVARVLVLEPDMILLDEPTANLDPGNATVIEKIVSRVNRGGKTVLMATHNMFQAKRLANRVAFLLNGELIECDDCESFFANPKDKRSRAFTSGEMVY